ncbi:MAG: nucleoside-triphosphatase, partial [Acidimicrobiia bacterium]
MAASMAVGLAERVLAGDARAAARLITLVENGDEAADEALGRFPARGQAKTIGVTGPAGCGKSTLVDRVIAEYRRRGLRVGVLAVDPSSPFS